MANTYNITLTYTIDHTATVPVEADTPEQAARIAAAAPPPPWEAWTHHPEFVSDTFVSQIDGDFHNIPPEHDRTVVTCGTPLTPEHKLSTAASLVKLAQSLCGQAKNASLQQELQRALDCIQTAHRCIVPQPPLPGTN